MSNCYSQITSKSCAQADSYQCRADDEGPCSGMGEVRLCLLAQLPVRWLTGASRTFSRRSPAVLASFARNAGALIKTFHGEVEIHARQNGSSIAGLHMLQQQLRVYEEIFKDHSNAVKDTISAQQKEINREFIPVIATAMGPAYDACTVESGKSTHLVSSRFLPN